MKKSMRKILVACLTLAMLMVNSLSVFASDVYGDFSVKFVFHDVDNGDAVVGDPQYMVVNGKEGVAQDVDISSIMPSGYEVDGKYTESTTVSVAPYLDGASKDVYVKKVQQTVTTLYLKFVLKDGTVVDSQTLTSTAVGDGWTFMLGQDYQLPEGYQLATGLDYEQNTNIQLPCGATTSSEIVVEPINGTVDPVDPEVPVTPVNPTPVKPAVEKDNNKTNDNTNKKVDTADKKTTKAEAPKTGDTANIAMNVFVMAICGAAIVTVIFRKRFTRR